MLKTLRFVNLLAVAATFGLTWCHVMEIPGKMLLDGPEWLAVQHRLYVAFGPPLGAPIELVAIATTWLLAVLERGRPASARWTLLAAVAVTAGLAVWFWRVAPANAVLAAWTPRTLPADWTLVRDRWETGHAIHALCFGGGFSALVAALLAEIPGAPGLTSASTAREGGRR